MREQRITHTKLIDLCGKAGIMVTRITRGYAYLLEQEKVDPRTVEISLGWRDIDGVTVRENVQKDGFGAKIRLIRTVRNVTGMSLADSKKVVEDQLPTLMAKAKENK